MLKIIKNIQYAPREVLTIVEDTRISLGPTKSIGKGALVKTESKIHKLTNAQIDALLTKSWIFLKSQSIC